MDEILPDVTFENIRAKAQEIGNTKEKKDNEKLLEILLQLISNCAGGDDPVVTFVLIKKKCPNANVAKVIRILKEKRGFDAKIIQYHYSLCDCPHDRKNGCDPCIKIHNTWSKSVY